MWVKHFDGKAVTMKLVDCPRGYLLVNTSTEAQTCSLCPAGTYSLSPTDGCEKGLCLERKCTQCSAGARCQGADNFEPLVEGSLWVKHFDGKAVTMKLINCPRRMREGLVP